MGMYILVFTEEEALALKESCPHLNLVELQSIEKGGYSEYKNMPPPCS